ncbi:MAG: methyltransferase, partial [Bacteroidales bacterium]
MTSHERIHSTINHKTPDRIPVDFGSTGVTGIHVRIIEGLRRYYGMEWKPVKVIEPYQMLGDIDDQLGELIGIDVVGLYGKKNMFGIANEGWKEFKTWWGQEVLLPGMFNTSTDTKGDLYVYPEGDLSVDPTAVMPDGSYFFNAIIRQEPFAEEDMDPENNLQEFGPISGEDLEWIATETDRLTNTGKGIIASFGGTALGDIALVPGLQLKHPKGIRDVQEWYMSTLTRQDYIHQVFEKQTEIALPNLDKISRETGNRIDAVFTCGTDFGTQTGQFCSP